MKSNILTSNELNRTSAFDQSKKIIVIGCVGEHAISEEIAMNLIIQKRQDLGRDGDFIGKSTTCMYVNDTHVIKVNQQISFEDGRIGSKWIEHRLKKEKDIALYHPSRTWFLLKVDQGWQAGNITIRLLPFHQLFEKGDLLTEEALPWIIQVCEKYLSHAARQEERLDEGLSNFGLDGSTLYYLDDDIFGWDHFHAFSALLACWFRRYSKSWFHAEATAKLGSEIRKILDLHFDTRTGVDAPHVIAEQIKAMFFPAGSIQEAADALRSSLLVRTGSKSELKQFTSLENLASCFDEDEPIALLGDIHANLPALEAVVARISSLGVKRMLVLGDIVGYGPHPSACIELLQNLGAHSIRGNHDHAIGSGQSLRSMSKSSSWVADWTQDYISAEQREYLLSLPTKLSHRPWMAVHGAPMDDTFFNAYVYNRTAEKNLQWLMDQGYRFCIHGHSHIQSVYTMQWGSVMQQQQQEEIDISNSTALICPGAVGQPRGGDCRAAFAILYPQQMKIINYRLDYPVQETIQDMIIHGFPEQLIQRLKDGI